MNKLRQESRNRVKQVKHSPWERNLGGPTPKKLVIQMNIILIMNIFKK